MASVVLGSALAGWRARRSVLAELTAALDAGVQTVRAGLDDAVSAPDPRADARRLVAAFTPNRHVHARLLGDAAAPPAPVKSGAPGWFLHLIAPALAPVDVVPAAVAGADRITVRLETDARNEVGEVWEQLCDAAAALAIFCALASACVAWTVQRALRPIGELAAGLSRVGAGDYSARIADSGASDLRPLVHGFNRAAGLLDEVRGRNARLSEHILVVQEEERAELARDLHDDVGPTLFAVSLAAATIVQLAADRRADAIAAHARAIADATARIQRSVTSILGRLRPIRASEAGLRPAMDRLVRFWRERNPQIDFDLRIMADEAAVDGRHRETILLLVQEALVNSIRHGRPERIGIAVSEQRGAVSITVSDDGCGSAARGGGIGPGIGLELMQERVAALDGTLRIGPCPRDRGWLVHAQLPA